MPPFCLSERNINHTRRACALILPLCRRQPEHAQLLSSRRPYYLLSRHGRRTLPPSFKFFLAVLYWLYLPFFFLS